MKLNTKKSVVELDENLILEAKLVLVTTEKVNVINK